MTRFASMAVAIVLASWSGAAFALDTVRIATSGSAIIWTMIEIGEAAGIWKDEGLAIVHVELSGDAPTQQALTAGAIDFGCGSGPGMGYRAKGVPALTVAALAGPPYNFALVTQTDSPIRSFDDLKGKRVGVTSAGSMTDWLVREIGRQKGWGPEGVQSLPLGGEKTRLAALRAHDIDGSLVSDQNAFSYEELKIARIVGTFGEIVQHFHTHVMYARDAVREANPELVRRVLRGWFRSVAWARAHRPEGVAIAATALGVSATAVDKAWDNEMRMMSRDGALEPEAVDTIRRSLPQLGMLDHEPEAKSLYTTEFTPVKF